MNPLDIRPLFALRTSLNVRTWERPTEARRRFLRLSALGAVLAARPGAYADELVRTAAQTEGPFFPDRLPLDTDNDLVIINDSLSPADGIVTWLSGRILSATGTPLRGALVEIWQCDARGAYLHSGSVNAQRRDGSFQGYGRFVTGTDGRYGFRTIKPVAYPGRTPHIHVRVSRGDTHLLTTQCYVRGDAGNDRDGILRALPAGPVRDSVLADFRPLEGSRVGELTAAFDVVLGVTPADS